MTDTQALVISLAKSLSDSSVIDYILYLNNFFSNIFLATTLKKLDIEIINTTWINTLDFFLSLV